MTLNEIIFLFLINFTSPSQEYFAFMTVTSFTPPVMLVLLLSSLKTVTQCFGRVLQLDVSLRILKKNEHVFLSFKINFLLLPPVSLRI